MKPLLTSPFLLFEVYYIFNHSRVIRQIEFLFLCPLIGVIFILFRVILNKMRVNKLFYAEGKIKVKFKMNLPSTDWISECKRCNQQVPAGNLMFLNDIKIRH